jgi:hypothetical protein
MLVSTQSNLQRPTILAFRSKATVGNCQDSESRIIDLRYPKNLSAVFFLFLFCSVCLLSGCTTVVYRWEPLSLVASPSTVNLGNVSVGTVATAAVSLVNKSLVPVNVTQLSVVGQSFSIAEQNALPVSIPAGSTYRVTVEFNPAVAGPASGQLTIAGDASPGGAISTPAISLTGSGIDVSILASISIGAAPGLQIPATFMGLSHEWVEAQFMMGDSSTGVDNIYRRLLKNLTAYGSGPLSIRVGGNSTDQTGEPNSNTAQPFAELSNALGVHFSLGVNLGWDDLALAENQAAAYISQMPTGSIDAIEIGNEPDIYTYSGLRQPPYTFSDYVADFNQWKTGILPLLPLGTKLMGPSCGTIEWLPYTEFFDAAEASALFAFSHHYYVGSGEVANPDDILLAPSSATAGPLSVATAVVTTHQFGIPFRIGEMNSLHDGGEEGVSNAFESALWAIDTMFEFANVGVDGVNWHGGGNSAYTYFELDTTNTGGAKQFVLTSVRPLYYGMLFFQEATGSSAHLLPVTLTTQANLKAWATKDASGTPRLAIINKDENLAGTVNVTLSGFTHVQVYRLTAPSYLSTSGVTFAGQTFDGSKDGLIQGPQTTEDVISSNGMFQISMPITSAALAIFSK